jgi:rRNA processing protein Krr1/Pno1
MADFSGIVVEVPKELRGRVIGKGGRTFREIRAKTGVETINMKDEGVYLQGNEEQTQQAKEMILSIIVCTYYTTLYDLPLIYDIGSC